jgi:hypothetical protein
VIRGFGDLGFGELVIYTITQVTKSPNHQLKDQPKAFPADLSTLACSAKVEARMREGG